MTFNIGEHVMIKPYEQIDDKYKKKIANGDPHIFTTGKSRLCGKSGVIVDKMISNQYSCMVYMITLDGTQYPSKSLFVEDHLISLDHVEETYRIESEAKEDKIVVKVIKTVNGEDEIVDQAYGFRYTDDMDGFIQAASYALRNIYYRRASKNGNNNSESGSNN